MSKSLSIKICHMFSDPKGCDLYLSSSKLQETAVEDNTDTDVQIVHQIKYRGERLIEQPGSWLFPKFLLGQRMDMSTNL